ncbi:MAG: polysaccharide biosynthesis/export family protein [Candidatus Omnitrophica bacterium]|nr:polysaccharide biosynthesis/export family protein [Candidatus Omnitrophota bacterium]
MWPKVFFNSAKFVRAGIWVFLLVILFFPISFADEESYTIHVGDLLFIEVYEEPDLSREVRVLTDGHLSFPLLGSIRAEGETVGALQKLITSKLAQNYLVDPQVLVSVKEYSHIYVFGEVENPGVFPLTGKMTVFEAITLAGGFTETANRGKVKVIRQDQGEEQVFEVDVSRVLQGGDLASDLELRAHDRVIVSRKFF